MPNDLWAHSPANPSSPAQPLQEHLRNVGELAARFGEKFGASEVCRMIGLAHDLGKARPRFQRYIRNAGPQVGHSDAGAAAAEEALGGFALPVAGHHAGLPSKGDAKARLDSADPEAVASARHIAAQLGLSRPRLDQSRFREPLYSEHLIRMCASALVDADRLDTERFYAVGEPSRGGFPALEWYLERLEAHLERFGRPESEVDRVRVEVQRKAREAAGARSSFFRMSVPTGGGKTLASLLFALSHAVEHGLDRVIVAIPYLSILDQTARTFAEVFGSRNVLEHHSAPSFANESGLTQDPDAESQTLFETRRKLSTENWDHPLILTTNVQLFESLLHNHPRAIRKLHNVARSVVVLDEVQTIPMDLIEPCITVLEWMNRFAGTSVLFCTATQPDYSAIRRVPSAIAEATEICSNHHELATKLRRVRFSFLGELDASEVARRAASRAQCLTIFNTRKDALAVFDAVADPDALYLSTDLVPKHRLQVLDEIRTRLARGLPCRLFSTQVVEAGVDLDCPVVMRVLGPLDSIVQAAGRCNREGKMPSLGECEVFVLRDGSTPPGAYKTASDVAHLYVPSRLDQIESVETQSDYYRALLERTSTNRKIRNSATHVQAAREALDFPLVEENTKFISDDRVSVIARAYAPQEIERLLGKWSGGSNQREIRRRLAQFSVSIPRYRQKQALEGGTVTADPASGLLIWEGPYDAKVGVARGVVHNPEDLIA